MNHKKKAKVLSNKVHVFTSCTSCYIPKARVLAESVKKFHPSVTFHLVLSDKLPTFFDLENEHFDSVIFIDGLDITDFEQWVFKHSLVEMCTAVKPLAFRKIFSTYEECEKIIFLDPDTVIFSKLDELFVHLDNFSILLTPHQLEPEKTAEKIKDNELAILRHGIFNLGFIGVKASLEGRQFIDWWSHRCLNFCLIDTANGLYTDQRWIDFVPSYFQDFYILRHPGCNVANWNLSNRVLSGDIENQILVNGKPLIFYHFSNSQSVMLDKYSVVNTTSKLLVEWYKNKCGEMGQAEYVGLECHYDFFNNGFPVSNQVRLLYRHNPKLQELFPNPFEAKGCSFFEWIQLNESIQQGAGGLYLGNLEQVNSRKTIDLLSKENKLLMAEISGMKSSKFWKLRSLWFKVKKCLGGGR